MAVSSPEARSRFSLRSRAGVMPRSAPSGERSTRAMIVSRGPGGRVPPIPETVSRLDEVADHVETEFRGSRVVWRSWGDGPPLVLLHGAFGSWTHWIRTIPAVSLRHRVITPDMPGFGDSDVPADDDLLKAIPQSLIAGLPVVLGKARRFDLVGFSFGSVMAGQLAADLAEVGAPARVDRVIFIAPAGLGLAVSDFDSLARTRPAMTPDEIAAVHRHNLSIMMFADPAAIDDTALAIQMANTARARARGRSYSRSDALAKASARIQARHMIAIWGEQDAYARRDLPAYEAAVSRLRPDIQIRRVASAGHWVQYEAAQSFNATILESLKDPGGA